MHAASTWARHTRAARALATAFWLASLLTLIHAPAARAAMASGGMAVVTTPSADLYLRDGPSQDSGILASLPPGTQVLVLDGPTTDADGGDWYHVSAAGQAGWCAAEWLNPSATPAVSTLFVRGTDGDGVRLRAAPDLDAGVLLVLPEGTAITPTGASQQASDYAWTPVQVGDATGWVASNYLSTAGTAPQALAAGPAIPVAVGNHATVVDTDGMDLRMRDGYGLAAPVFAYVPAGAVVAVVNGPEPDAAGAPWYGVDYDGVLGWVAGQYLAPTDQPLTPRGVGVSPTEMLSLLPPSPDRGPAIVAEALKHLGAPYVWGGDTPAGWDCSGMIQWVYKQVTGVTLPRVSHDQFYIGIPLRMDEIQAGDLVFFANTDGVGITHNGIALGDGRFIHARSEQYGTTISNLSDPYWTAHYAGARRP
jgi:uncharacterized protein YraI